MEPRMNGFKADLSKVCGCEIYIVGRTRKEMLENLRRHMKDVHRVRQVAVETRRMLRKATEEIW
jgi:predicted small metal-binding protein